MHINDFLQKLDAIRSGSLVIRANPPTREIPHDAETIGKIESKKLRSLHAFYQDLAIEYVRDYRDLAIMQGIGSKSKSPFTLAGIKKLPPEAVAKARRSLFQRNHVLDEFVYRTVAAFKKIHTRDVSICVGKGWVVFVGPYPVERVAASIEVPSMQLW